MNDQPRNFSMPQGSPCPEEQRTPQDAPEKTKAIALVETRPERLVSVSDIDVLDTAKYEQMWRVATAMANSTLVPESLRGVRKGDNFTPFEPHQVVANCFKVVNQAVRWHMDPFALIDCASIVHGRLCWEGKVIAAVLDSLAGISLDYEYTGEGELMRVLIKGTFPDGKVKDVKGSVAQWKTTGKGSPWVPAEYERQLAYRGAREWARRHKPAVMLGVYGNDERFDDHPSIDITPTKGATPPSAPPPRRQSTTPPPPPKSARRTKPAPLAGKSLKAQPEAKVSEVEVPEEEAMWLVEFGEALAECRNKFMINHLVDRHQAKLDAMSPAGQKRSSEVINAALSEIQR